jgi:hypothetical protein
MLGDIKINGSRLISLPQCLNQCLLSGKNYQREQSVMPNGAQITGSARPGHKIPFSNPPPAR